ncbi:unnamed protein product, partial [marine sediment metagenome]
MKNVLLVTYFYPPRQPDFAGRHAHGLVKYLPQFGWEATVLTARLPGPFPADNVQETEYDDVLSKYKWLLGIKSGDRLMHNVAEVKSKFHVPDFILRTAGEWLAFPDPQKGWLKHATKYHEQWEEYDAVLSISPPVTSHLIAQKIKERTGKPWIAYMLDPWSLNHYSPYSWIRLLRDMRLEHDTLQNADEIVTISQAIAGKLMMFHERPTHSVPLGYDPDDYKERTLSNEFSIVHTGTLHEGYQDPEPLFKALQELYADGLINPDHVYLYFYGPKHKWLDKLAGKYGIRIAQYGIVPHAMALKMQQLAQVLLLLKWNDPEEKGIINSKLSEYLGARRPILAIG